MSPPVLAVSAGATLLLIAAALAACFLLILLERLILTPRLLLTAEDVVTSPGQPLAVRVEAERDIFAFWDPPLRGVEVSIFALIDGTRALAASGTTNEDGILELALPALSRPGRHEYVAVAGTQEAPFLAEILPPSAPVLIVDIDGTIAHAGQVTHAFRRNESIRPKAGAPEALARLAGRYAIVYLTARDHIFRPRTLEWLRARGFPVAPVLMRRRRVWSQPALEHKRERLRQLAARLTLSAGVGDLPSDARVYREHNMRAFILGRSVEGAVSVPDWAAVVAQLEGAP